MQSIQLQSFPKIAALAFAVLMFWVCAGATYAWADSELSWHTDYTKAKQIAAEQEKHVLLNFTGSDWCPWCIRLDKNVFSTPEFKEFASSELVLVKVDFPKKHQLSQKQSEANQSLARKYRVRGYPTLIMLNSQGRRVGTTGFRKGSATSYIEHLRGMME
jgi:protein disulfide-isomerase